MEVYGSADLWGPKRQEIVDWPKVSKTNSAITYCGKQAKEELARAYNRAALCIVPSRVPEGMSRVSLEAQSCGCPVIGGDESGMTEAIIPGETGLLISEITAEKLARGITAMIDDKKKLQWMSSRTARFAHNFSVARVIQSYIEIIEQNKVKSG